MIPTIDPWKFAWKFQCSPASFFKLSIQPWKFALKLSIQPCKFALKVSVKRATPPWKFDWKFATNFQQTFRAVNKKWREKLFFLKKIVFIFLKTMFFCFKKMSFYFKKCFSKKIGFMYVIGWKKIKKNIQKEVETKLVVQSTLWAVIENMFFWCLGLLTNNHRDLLLGSF